MLILFVYLILFISIINIYHLMWYNNTINEIHGECLLVSYKPENYKEYLSWQEDKGSGPVVVVQIEHIDAVENLEKILNVDGVDAFIIGPYDLSCSMGIPGEFNNPKFKEIMNVIIKVGNKLNAISGLHVVEPDIDKLNDAINTGYKFIAYSVDIRMLDVAARSGVNEARKPN